MKMDFLGLRTLTVIQNAVRMARKIISRIWTWIELITMTGRFWNPSERERPRACSSWKAPG